MPIEEKLYSSENEKVLLLGNEVIFRGFLESLDEHTKGINLTGYPGTPASEILVIGGEFYKNLPEEWKGLYDVTIENNEAVAVACGLGASWDYYRCLVVMKHVGLNVASDILSSGSLSGVRGGLVILNGGDPGALSSQNEQNNRFYSNLFNIPIIEPSTPQEAKDFVKKAFELSEYCDQPVIYNVTTRLCHSRVDINLNEINFPKKRNLVSFRKNTAKFVNLVPFQSFLKRRIFEDIWNNNQGSWKNKNVYELMQEKKDYYTKNPEIFLKELKENVPKDTYSILQREQENFQFNSQTDLVEWILNFINDWRGNRIELAKNFIRKNNLNYIIDGEDRETGIITAGLSYSYLREVISNSNLDGCIPILKLGVVNPIDEKIVIDFACNVRKILVIEELENFIEKEIISICHKNRIQTEVKGKEFIPPYGELQPTELEIMLSNSKYFSYSINRILRQKTTEIKASQKIISDAFSNIKIPARTPVFCPGCPHRASVYYLKKFAEKQKLDLLVLGDIGCYGIAFNPNLNLTDTFVAMGHGGSIGFGISNKNKKVSFVGDSTFFHSAISDIQSAVQNNHEILYLILDNKTTAMTGHQPSSTTGTNIKGELVASPNIENILFGLGITYIKKMSPFDKKYKEELTKIFEQEIIEKNPVRALILEEECALAARRKNRKQPYRSFSSLCRDCRNCAELSCPAFIFSDEFKPVIDSSMCNGCGLCKELTKCPVIQKA